MKFHDYDADDAEDLGPSKSELKRQSDALQSIGEQLMALDDTHWQQLSISDNLRRALEESRRVKGHEALRRHRQFIGKLMRNEDIEPLRDYLDKLASHRELNTRAFHALETLRENLLKGGQEAMGAVLSQFPHCDSQKLRQLVRDAKQATDPAHAHKASKLLFRFLRDLAEIQAPGED